MYHFYVLFACDSGPTWSIPYISFQFGHRVLNMLNFMSLTHDEYRGCHGYLVAYC